MKFTNLLKSIILESSRFKLLYDKLVQQNEKDKKEGKKIPFETFKAIVFADPDTKTPRGMEGDIDTISVNDMENVKIGKYTQWLLKNFIAPKNTTITAEVGTPEYKKQVKEYQHLFLEDLYKTTEDLKKYERFKNQLPQESRDINKISVEQLFDLVKDFKLEKVKASKKEKEEAASTYSHPGADVVFRGDNWTIVKIERQDQLGKDAACFYGGQHEYEKGESRWCTSSPGLTYFNGYIKDGPLYVILPNTSNELGQVSKLPVERYQFHFPSNQFMDRHDRQQDLVALLNGKLTELKDFFKPEFAKGLVVGGGKKLDLKIPDSSAGKFIALYGFDELFDNLPDDLTHILVENKSKSNLAFSIPPAISRFQNLRALMLDNIVSSLPDGICQLSNLELLGLPNNPSLKTLPNCVKDLPSLMFLNVDKCDNLHIDQDFENILEKSPDGRFYFVMK
jgi:Leucine-rich repeat (LRR) protein